MMIVTVDGERMTITAEGHCGYAPHGQDIVCAGASMLLEALMERCTRRDCLFDDSGAGDGYVFIHAIDCEPTHWWFDLVVHGLQLLEEQYPDYIRVSIAYGS